MANKPKSHRLVDVLSSLPPVELDALISRLGIRIDATKRLDPAAQVGRVLVSLPDLREPSRLAPASVELLHRAAEAHGSLVVTSLPPALAPLAARGLMFARETKSNVELILPTALLLQMRTWEGEDPRGLRALLAQASLETSSAIAGHYLGRPATPPIALSLEAAWEVLGDTDKLTDEIKKLSATERRVLEGAERDGGEVDTEELLELEREPMRLRTASGAAPSRRGVGFSLERRGLLIPVHPNRHIVPTEVSRIVGAANQREREERREQVKSFVLTGDHAPRRAKFSLDPGPIALACALAAREPGSEVRQGIGTPRSLVQRLGTRFGRDGNTVALIVALSRATGLWDVSATTPSSPPGSLHLHEVSQLLFAAWRHGGAWDEARLEPEVLRLPPDSRDPSPIGALREIVIDALRDLGDDRWVPWDSLEGYLKSDDRVAGLTRLLRRWADRGGLEMVEPMTVARKILLESLPALGIVDLGEDVESGGELSSALALRLTPRGRALVSEKSPTHEGTASKFLDTHVLRLGPTALVSGIIGIASLLEVGRAQDTLDLIVAPQTLAKALAAGIEAEALRVRIEALAPLPETLSRTLAQASIVLGRATFVAASGFLWIEDHNIREMLRTRRPTAELFVDPSPPTGLLVAQGVDADRLTRRCRTIGVELLHDGQVLRARSIPPPTHRSSTKIPKAHR